MTVSKRMYLLFSYLLIALLAASACQEDTATVYPSHTYFPQQVGNWWEYGGTRKEIVDTIQWQNLPYYVWVTTYSSNDSTYTDTAYYRMNEDEKVYVKYSATQEESLLFDFSLSEEETIRVDLSHGYKLITLRSTDTTVALGGTQLSECLSFFYDIPGLADDEHSIILAPNIGIASTVPVFGTPQELSSAFVGGRMYTF